MNDLPDVDELNKIQAAWMDLQHDDPKPKQDKVFAMMKRLPKCYISGHDGRGSVMLSGGPLCQTIAFEEAFKICQRHGGRTDVAWNGKLGQWYKL